MPSLVTRAFRSARRRWNTLAQWVRYYRDPATCFLSFPPGHFHSPLPSQAEIPPTCAQTAGDGLQGIDLDPNGQLSRLREWAEYARQWPFPAVPTPGFRYHSQNPYFLAADGSVLYSVLRHFRPARVVEVGSGHSSALMLDTADRHFGSDTKFTFVEPHPDRLLGLLSAADRGRCEIIATGVQKVEPETFARLDRGDMLFIDSSHVSKVGSDLNYLVFEVLPRLAPGVVVHVHDIFWPFEYPVAWYRKGWAWNEAYLMRAFLQYNAEFRVLVWPSYLEASRADEFRAAWPVPSADISGTHASLWLVRKG